MAVAGQRQKQFRAGQCIGQGIVLAAYNQAMVANGCFEGCRIRARSPSPGKIKAPALPAQGVDHRRLPTAIQVLGKRAFEEGEVKRRVVEDGHPSAHCRKQLMQSFCGPCGFEKIAVAQTVNGGRVSDGFAPAPGEPDLLRVREHDDAGVERHPGDADDLVGSRVEARHLQVNGQKRRLIDAQAG